MYRVTVTREDGFWVGVVEGVPGGATETRRLAALDGEIRDLLSGLLDLDPEAIDLDYDLSPALGSAAADVQRYRTARAKMDDLRAEYEDAQVSAALDLRAEGVSLRDAAEVLGVSFQRVQQLVSS